MKGLKVCIVSSVILLALSLVLQFPGSAYAGSRSERVVTGELVVTNGAHNQFRLATQPGFFTAPTGMALGDLDGKPVRVEFDREGRVVGISQIPVRIEPVKHGFEVISGQLVLRDSQTGRFAIAGDSRTYAVPAGIDIGQYVGQLVELRLSEEGRVMSINRIARSADSPVR